MLDRILSSDRPLIAVHRGKSGACIIENTVLAGQCALMSGADIIEFDACRTRDGHAVVFHTGMEFRFFARPIPPVQMCSLKSLKKRKLTSAYYGDSGLRISELSEFLSQFKGKCILNFDRIWCADVDYCLDIVAKLEMFDQMLIKCSASSQTHVVRAIAKYPEAWFMPICVSREEYEKANKICAEIGVPIRGYEVIFRNESDYFCSDEFVEEVHSRGQFLWVNTINLSKTADMCADHSDRFAITEGCEKHFGYLADKGFDIFQTDWPAIMRHFFDNRNNKA